MKESIRRCFGKGGMRETERSGVTYLMSSWMTAFVSKHPNMHCSATRGKISLQHPMGRGLLPLRRGAECAQAEEVSVFVLLRVCMCVSSSVSAHTHLFVCAFMDPDLLTTLPL